MKHRVCQHLCPKFQTALDVLARPWNGLIMATLESAGPLRFGALRARLPELGDRMLSFRLKDLEARGLVIRRVDSGPPIRVGYELSDIGRGFKEVALALGRWGERFTPEPGSASGAPRRSRAVRRARARITTSPAKVSGSRS